MTSQLIVDEDAYQELVDKLKELKEKDQEIIHYQTRNAVLRRRTEAQEEEIAELKRIKDKIANLALEENTRKDKEITDIRNANADLASAVRILSDELKYVWAALEYFHMIQPYLKPFGKLKEEVKQGEYIERLRIQKEGMNDE